MWTAALPGEAHGCVPKVRAPSGRAPLVGAPCPRRLAYWKRDVGEVSLERSVLRWNRPHGPPCVRRCKNVRG